MNAEWVRGVCMKLPQTTEEVLWGNDLVFKIGGKMYAAAALEPGHAWVSFKCTPEKFAELTEREGVIPAPYAARYHWVAVETADAIPAAEIRRLIGESYELVVAKLPKKTQMGIRSSPQSHRGTEKSKVKRKI
ncbi:MAG TPA: MmcQ/YjbR family DNA-binding protein [Bryobacteraceae bacterium]|jgi:predicted DNA-binding protein (MmcQ/YjbR family)|nr:MmcQ/YjbR family DNA-binding protein [Bryobacteraceae bacterium]